MADLGSVGATIDGSFYCILDVAMSYDITNNPIRCVSTPFDRAPRIELWETFQGIVQDASGVGVARTVHAIRRNDMRLIATTTSSSIDGSFTIKVPFVENYIVLRLDSSDNIAAVDRVEPV